jgi:hypothetical protein
MICACAGGEKLEMSRGILFGKSGEVKAGAKPGQRWEDNIKNDLKYVSIILLG